MIYRDYSGSDQSLLMLAYFRNVKLIEKMFENKAGQAAGLLKVLLKITY